MSHHPPVLVPVAPIATRAILPDDPGVAFRLATELLGDDRKMANHHRGLWGYVGSARADGRQLTIQSTGVGAASARLVLDHLAELGVRQAVRVGTARSSSHRAGTVLAATSAADEHGTVALDHRLSSALASVADASVSVVSTRLPQAPAASGAFDLETTELARAAIAHGLVFGALLAVTELLDHDAVTEATTEAGIRAGRVLADF